MRICIVCTLVSQHVRVETLVSKVAHEAVTAKRNTSNHHTRRLRPTVAPSKPVSIRSVGIEIAMAVLKLPLLKHREGCVKPRHIEHKLMPSGHKPTLASRRLNELSQRLAYATDRPGNLRVVVQRHNQAIAIAIAHTFKHQLQSRRKSKRPKGASLRAATAREEAHPPIRPQRRNIGRRAVRREQEEE